MVCGLLARSRGRCSLRKATSGPSRSIIAAHSRMQSFGGRGHLVQQDRFGLEARVDIGGVGMVQIGGQLWPMPGDRAPCVVHGSLHCPQCETVALGYLWSKDRRTRVISGAYGLDSSLLATAHQVVGGTR